MEALLAGPRVPTAVFAEYDEMAFGAMRALRRAGLRRRMTSASWASTTTRWRRSST